MIDKLNDLMLECECRAEAFEAVADFMGRVSAKNYREVVRLIENILENGE